MMVFLRAGAVKPHRDAMMNSALQYVSRFGSAQPARRSGEKLASVTIYKGPRVTARWLDID